MSLVNAVHELIEVAAGRRNLSGAAADELHAAIDAEQPPAAPETVAEPEPQPPVYEIPAQPAQTTAGVPWQS